MFWFNKGRIVENCPCGKLTDPSLCTLDHVVKCTAPWLMAKILVVWHVIPECGHCWRVLAAQCAEKGSLVQRNIVQHTALKWSTIQPWWLKLQLLRVVLECSLQCAVFSLQWPLCNVQFKMCYVQCENCSLQCTVSRVQFAVYSM